MQSLVCVRCPSVSLFNLGADEGFPTGRLDRRDFLLEDGGAGSGKLAQ